MAPGIAMVRNVGVCKERLRGPQRHKRVWHQGLREPKRSTYKERLRGPQRHTCAPAATSAFCIKVCEGRKGTRRFRPGAAGLPRCGVVPGRGSSCSCAELMR
jgi:hypothetical protein